MPESIYLKRFISQVNFLNDFPKGSLLIMLNKVDSNLNESKFEIIYFELKTGKREEYFEHFLKNPKFIRYFIYPKLNEYYNTKEIISEIESLEKNELGISILKQIN